MTSHGEFMIFKKIGPFIDQDGLVGAVDPLDLSTNRAFAAVRSLKGSGFRNIDCKFEEHNVNVTLG